MAIERLGVTVKKGLFVFPLNESENKMKQDGRTKLTNVQKLCSLCPDGSQSFRIKIQMNRDKKKVKRVYLFWHAHIFSGSCRTRDGSPAGQQHHIGVIRHNIKYRRENPVRISHFYDFST
jgi:hypothetical protein